MKSILIFGVVAVVLFTASAGLSIYLRMAPTERVEETKDSGKKKSTAPEGDIERNPVVRPSPTAGADEAAKLAAQYGEKLAALQVREARLEQRHKNLEIILTDVRSEREVIDRLRRQIADELKSTSAKATELDNKAADLERRRQDLAKNNTELVRNRVTIEKEEAQNLTKMALMYDAMAAENAAKIFQQMAEGGNLDMAVKLLSQMKPTKSSKVLSEFADASLAVQLMKKMKEQRPPSATPGSPTAPEN